MGLTVEVVVEGVEIVAASEMDERFVHPHLVPGSRKSWRSEERRSDWVFAARPDAGKGNGVEKREMSGRRVDKPYDP